MKPVDLWSAVERYVAERVLTPDPTLHAALATSAGAGLPSIQISPVEGQLLFLLVSMLRARRVLEVGTLGGYSTIWLARAMAPGGSVVTLEIDLEHARVARENLERAGLADRVDLRVGAALETLPRLAAEHGEPFDFVFIDADKENTAAYFEWALKLSRPGSLIVVDNVVREGGILDARSDDAAVQGVRRFLDRLAAEPSVRATVMQTVGTKGHDGMAIVLVNATAS